MSAPVKASVGETVLTEIEVRGHRFQADEPPEKGGEDRAPTPSEIMGAGLAACTAMTLRMYANLKKLPVTGIDVELSQGRVNREETADAPVGGNPGGGNPEGGERDEFHRIEMKITVHGDLDDKMMERLHYIARRCPVHRIVTEDPVVIHRLERGG